MVFGNADLETHYLGYKVTMIALLIGLIIAVIIPRILQKMNGISAFQVPRAVGTTTSGR